MTTLRTSVVLAVCMALAAAGGIAAKPSLKSHGSAPRYILEDIVPTRVGDWRLLPQSGMQVVNPQTKQLLDKIYSQLLTRTYVNPDGYRVMLSLAYGDEQRGQLQAHMPEICYPAQGFRVHSNQPSELDTPFGDIAVRRLTTSYGARNEPVTYWFTVGDRAIRSKLDQRIVEVRLGLTGQIPDGLLFRVSSIDPEPSRAYVEQDKFVAELLKAVSSRDRIRLAGLGPPTPTP